MIHHFDGSKKSVTLLNHTCIRIFIQIHSSITLWSIISPFCFWSRGWIQILLCKPLQNLLFHTDLQSLQFQLGSKQSNLFRDIDNCFTQGVLALKFPISILKPTRIRTTFILHRKNVVWIFVWMNWKFARFHKILKQTDAKIFSFLSWQTKKF